MATIDVAQEGADRRLCTWHPCICDGTGTQEWRGLPDEKCERCDGGKIRFWCKGYKCMLEFPHEPITEQQLLEEYRALAEEIWKWMPQG